MPLTIACLLPTLLSLLTTACLNASAGHVDPNIAYGEQNLGVIVLQLRTANAV